MEQISEFLIDNYIWLIGVFLFLMFTLIGYLADSSRKKKTKELQKNVNAVNKKQEELKGNAIMSTPTSIVNNNIQPINNTIPTQPNVEPNTLGKEKSVIPEIKDEYKEQNVENKPVETELKTSFELPKTDTVNDKKAEVEEKK